MPETRFYPEGAGPPPPDLLALERAAGGGQIFQAAVVKCTDAHDLILDLGGARGVIPRQEAALGVREGEVRDIAIISRVGKPVSFTVAARAAGGELILSRRLAQQAALDWHMANTWPGDIIPARVTHLESFGAFVDIGCGLTSFIGIENISVSRIPHPGQRFAPRMDILAAVLEKDRALGRITLTHRELLGTWQENAARLRPGDTVQGIVRGVEDYGMFVELFPNLSGLAERRPGFAAGDRVSVYVKSILPQRMKIKLVVIEGLPSEPCRLITQGDYYLTRGPITRWQYSPEGCDRSIGRAFYRPPGGALG